MKLEEYTTEFIEQLFNKVLNFETPYVIYSSKSNWIYSYLLKKDTAAAAFKDFITKHEIRVLSDFHLVPNVSSTDEILLDFFEAIPFTEIFEEL